MERLLFSLKESWMQIEIYKGRTIDAHLIVWTIIEQVVDTFIIYFLFSVSRSITEIAMNSHRKLFALSSYWFKRILFFSLSLNVLFYSVMYWIKTNEMEQ